MSAEAVHPAPFNNPKLRRLPPPETLIFKDTFSRSGTSYPPDSTSLGISEVGGFPYGRGRQNSNIDPYGARIVNGAIGIVGNTPSAARVAVTANVGVSDGVFRAKLVSGQKNSDAHAIFRFIDPANHGMIVTAGGRWSLFSRVSGTSTLIAQGTVYAANGDELELWLNGSELQLFVNGVLSAQVTNSDNATGTRFGIQHNLPAGETATPLTLWDDLSLSSQGAWS
jgi:hypothetical protein